MCNRKLPPGSRHSEGTKAQSIPQANIFLLYLQKRYRFRRGRVDREVYLHMELMNIFTLNILIQFHLFIWCIYCLFYIITTSDADPVLNSYVPPTSSKTAELDSAGVDISYWHLFADVHTNAHLHTCAYSQFSSGPVYCQETLIYCDWKS